jgi:hypothetical protein
MRKKKTFTEIDEELRLCAVEIDYLGKSHQWKKKKRNYCG